MKITSKKGFADILPGEVETWQWVEAQARQVFSVYNFAEIRIPILEKTELFSRSIGETTDIVEKEMYTFDPLSRASQMVFVNNVAYGSGNMDVDLQSEGLVTNNTIIGNVFLRGPGSTYSNKPVHIRNTGNWPVPSTSKVYVSDNQAVEATSDPWSVVDATGGTVPLLMKATLPPSWPSHMTRLPASEDVTLNRVLNNAGARPADRDPVDARIVRQVRNRSGQIINCVAPNGTTRCNRNAGGWPTLAQNRRALTLPASPNTVTASGYTNLELWLHRMSAQVEGRSPLQPTPPVLSNR